MDTDKKMIRRFTNIMNNVDSSRKHMEITVEDLFGTLQHSVIATWRKHLRSAKYSKHMALDEFYKQMPEKVDALIEAWMGVKGRKIGGFNNVVKSTNLNTMKYLQELRKVVKAGYSLMDDEPELKACLDDIAELIDSTMYKVKELSESEERMDLMDFLTESLLMETNINKSLKSIASLYNDDGDLVSVASCFQWLEELDWKKMSAKEYAKEVHKINDDIEVDLFMDRYANCMVAMAEVGKKQALDFIKQIATKEEIEDYLDL